MFAIVKKATVRRDWRNHELRNLKPPYLLLCFLSIFCFAVEGCQDERGGQTERTERVADGDTCIRTEARPRSDAGRCPLEPDSGRSSDVGIELDESLLVDTGFPTVEAMSNADVPPLDGHVADVDTDAERTGEMPTYPHGFEGGAGMVMRDLPYAVEDSRQVLDLYRTTAPGPNSLLIWVHGGAGVVAVRIRLIDGF